MQKTDTPAPLSLVGEFKSAFRDPVFARSVMVFATLIALALAASLMQ
jgi:hypothetical protein